MKPLSFYYQNTLFLAKLQYFFVAELRRMSNENVTASGVKKSI